MTQPATATRPKRMTLDKVFRAKRGPFRVLIYGPEKVGKSSWAKDSPSPIFISGDNGLKYLSRNGEPIDQFPVPESYADVVDAIDELTTSKHAFETLVIDPIGWIEPLVHGEYMRRYPKNERGEPMRTISDYGYYKGQIGSVDIWRELLARLERLQRDRSMNIIIVAHSQVKMSSNPMGNEFERYCLALDGGPKSERAAGVFAQWPDAILFANYVAVTRRVKGKDKGIGTGTRALYTQPCDAYHAGNRYGLPAQLSLDFAEFAAHLSGGMVDETNAALTAELRALVAGTELEQAVETALAANPTTEQIRIAINRAALKLNRTTETEETNAV